MRVIMWTKNAISFLSKEVSFFVLLSNTPFFETTSCEPHKQAL